MNRIKICFTLLLAFVAIGLGAQTKVGLRAGINLATITDFQVEDVTSLDQSSIVGMNFAAYSEIGISNLFAIQPEITFIQKGTDVTASELEGMPDLGVKMIVNYLEVSTLAKVQFGRPRLKAFVVAGPSVGYALGGKGTVKFGSFEMTEDIEFDDDIDDDGVKDQRWDISGILGVGGALALGPGEVVLDVRYALDFTDFLKFKDGAPSGYEKSYNRGLGISLGYQIPIGKRS